MYEAQYVARIEKIKIIGSTFMAACGLISGRKNSQDYDAATEQNTTEPFSKERLKETLSLNRSNSSIVSITFHSGLKTENYNCDVNADFIKLMTSSWYLASNDNLKPIIMTQDPQCQESSRDET